MSFWILLGEKSKKLTNKPFEQEEQVIYGARELGALLAGAPVHSTG